MTESQWLSCEDPARMLAAIMPPVPACPTLPAPPSSRKLRLWVEACRAAEMARNPHLTDRAGGYRGYDLDSPGELAAAVSGWSACSTDLAVPAAPERATLLREIIGNPFRPVTLPAPTGRWSWRTPDILSLASAAYNERPVWRRCEVCHGTRDGRYYPGHSCETCRGRGRIRDGGLDPFRLALLADALEEAGCDSEDVLRHLRGQEECLYCLRPIGGVLLGHTVWMPLRGPHYLGCWALDLVFGKE